MKKGEFSEQIITKELWKLFRKEFPEHAKLSWKEFYSAWGDIAEVIREEAITNPLGVKLGSYTGELKLQYLPYKFEAPDPVTSKELGEEVNHVNLVSRGKVGKVKWERRWAVRFNKLLQFFAFEATRELTKAAKVYIDGNPEKLRVSRNTLGGKHVWKSLKEGK